MSATNHTRLKVLMKYLGITKKYIADKTGLEYRSVRNNSVPKRFSRWLIFTLDVFEELMEEIRGLKEEIKELKGQVTWQGKDVPVIEKSKLTARMQNEGGTWEPIEMIQNPLFRHYPKPKDDETKRS